MLFCWFLVKHQLCFLTYHPMHSIGKKALCKKKKKTQCATHNYVVSPIQEGIIHAKSFQIWLMGPLPSANKGTLPFSPFKPQKSTPLLVAGKGKGPWHCQAVWRLCSKAHKDFSPGRAPEEPELMISNGILNSYMLPFMIMQYFIWVI